MKKADGKEIRDREKLRDEVILVCVAAWGSESSSNPNFCQSSPHFPRQIWQALPSFVPSRHWSSLHIEIPQRVQYIHHQASTFDDTYFSEQRPLPSSHQEYGGRSDRKTER
jgi:hypothetical protein